MISSVFVFLCGPPRRLRRDGQLPANGGQVDILVEQLEQTAEEFINPMGWHEGQHYLCAADAASRTFDAAMRTFDAALPARGARGVHGGFSATHVLGA